MTKKINKKKVILILILIIAIITLIFLISRTFSRYESNATATKNLDIAFWVVDDTVKTQAMVLDDLYPSDTEFGYTFSVLNNDGTKVAETAMEYEIVLTSTTNLPLTYRVVKNVEEDEEEDCVVEETLYTDDDGTYLKKIVVGSEANSLKFDADITDNFTKKVTDTFTIYVKFPATYKNQHMYADLIESVNIELSAKQIISGE